MRIAISGASGFVGTHLSAYLQGRGHTIVPLVRRDFADDAQERLARLLNDCDAVVNLAGVPINHRWSAKYKQELIASRVDTTHRLVEAIDRSECVKTLISTSAVGYYPNVGCYDEGSSERGSGFLSDLCAAWEAEAQRVKVRCVITRFGVVLAEGGGAFVPLSHPARLGVAVVVGSGLQPFSWIDADDLVRAEEFLLLRSDLTGVFNLTAPEKLTHREFMELVAHHYKSWFTLPVPAFSLRMVFGEAADFMLCGQCVVPTRLLEAGFRFSTPSAREFLEKL